ncbi:MAG: hypothetical protein K8S87_10855 [Planctomycetes bacterium]|nr:hypothetical protein [Planctomycetota bacterium]
MKRQNRRKTPVNSKTSTVSENNVAEFFQNSAKNPNAYFEEESNPWFDVNCCDDEKQQIDNYINRRFNEFNDSELLEFLKTNAKFRKIVSNVRQVYIKTDSARLKTVAPAKAITKKAA